jgi:transcriptional regulator with PAS, ATPase and Fis domain/CHASE2 domain-containing sensor protein
LNQLKSKKQTIILLSITILASLLLIFFSDFRKNVDEEIQTVIVKTRGEVNPDTNIIIIHFSEDDIARIGPWPIKRNYYALLINQLSNLGVKKIGLEIFLSSKFVTQSIYDNLLRKEIEKSGRVVLSSLAGRITDVDNQFFTDSLSFPSPKILDENLVSGHINYIFENDFKIPLVVVNKDIQEKAFAYQISETPSKENYLIVNFISGWEKFRKYSALEFANRIYEGSPELNRFKNKIVIIGISDPQIAQTIQTPFDDQLPGVGLHAFVLDNLLNSRSIQDDCYLLSMILFPILLLGFIFLKNYRRTITTYIVASIIILTILFITISEFYLKISPSLLIIPFLSLIIYEGFSYFRQGQKTLKGVIDEATVLRNLLVRKENELSNLQNELSESGEQSSQLSNKIELLQKDIEKLKENDDDRLKVPDNIERKVENFHGLIFVSVSMAKVVQLIKKAAPTNSVILITGESGTGKELVARAIHSISNRRDKNFIAVNCGALSDSLLESELFGHVRGSFTGANADKQGRFELADQGTIFLDEIGETSENFQIKMLRVLQSGEIEKVGSTKIQKVDVRVIAATNKNLSELIKEKKFREDLYYRLNVITTELPPLRERKEEVEVLANSFLQAENSDLGLSKAVLQALNDYQWRGNVRELESVIKRAIIFAKSEKRNLIQLSDLPKEIVKETKYSFEDLVLESLRSKKFSHSSIVETAKDLGNVNRTMISENFRGLVLKTLVENSFDIQKTTDAISDSKEKEVRERVLQKVQTFLSNIEKDLERMETSDFESIKTKLSSKYKNLPSKFHFYLDEVLKRKIETIF